MTLSKRTQHVLFAYGLHALVILFGILGPIAPSANRLTLTHSIADDFMQWDSQWFIYIAKYGYLIPAHAQQAFAITGNVVPFSPAYRAAAFFPGLPVIIRLLSPIGALVLVEILFFCSLWLMYGLVEREQPALKSVAVILFAVNPCAIYFSSLYTETFSLFGILLIMYGLRQPRAWRSYSLSLVGVMIATSMHDLGVFCIAFTLRFIRLRLWWRALGYVAAAGVVPLIYEAYLYATVHTPFAILAAEDTWERSWRAPFVNVLESFIRYPLTLDTLVVALMMGLVIVQIIRFAMADGTWRVTREEQVVESLESALWMAGILLLSACAYIFGDPLKSVLRFLCILWPAFVPGFLLNRSASARLPWVSALMLAFGSTAAFGAALFCHGWFFQ
ncbi:hypothetical protein NZD89_09590 [Alicyclobacillus fastidiosus]|uniref:Glycosyltransferase RgtA/B/C/D-like domain-containing protein n=1 Tax=Alicyclobacillus fastidiosus TaxID=392011 RepID=A0ABY6ZL02_9BACL|nr:hypothetical protein [Alicyclobacillus fastidiosus]WAH43605.1 hypothetical protein NZD89_09590 [Alicyclobacillus fastidiosus]GMA59791.1 hypothetical protein GCM10025859_02310 [Alicyclobacillus fastidiosus]